METLPSSRTYDGKLDLTGWWSVRNDRQQTLSERITQLYMDVCTLRHRMPWQSLAKRS